MRWITALECEVLTMWRGVFEFEPEAATYRGVVGDTHFHAHFAIQVVRGLDRPVSVVTADGAITGQIVMIGSLVRHRLHPQDDAVVRWIEPSGAEGVALAARRTAPVTVVDRVPSQLQAAGLDDAVRRALGQMVSGSQSLASIAQHMGISPHRLRREARAALGGSLCHWSLWLKLRRSARAIVDGEPLAQAAAAGGFADQAHLTRTMRAMFGITPGALVSALAPALESAAERRIDRDAPGGRG